MLAILSIAVLALATSLSSALVIPRAHLLLARQATPASYDTSTLEPYDTYHERYMALDCEDQHNTTFFASCCHPLLLTQSLSDRPADCDPANDEGDCDGGDDGSSSAAPSGTPAPVNVGGDPAPTEATTSTQSSSTPPPPPSTTTPTSTHTTPKKTTTSAAPAPSPSVNTGGVATFFFQNGVAGACGTVHSDNDIIAAIDQDRYGNSGNSSPLCGKQVQITNLNNQKQVTVTIADDCPTCDNANSIDLSVGAFTSIATEEEGEVPISWFFID